MRETLGVRGSRRAGRAVPRRRRVSPRHRAGGGPDPRGGGRSARGDGRRGKVRRRRRAASGEVVTWGLNACGGDGGLDASPISPASLLSDPALAATPRLVRHAATNDFRDDKAVAVVFGYTQMLVLVASGALYSCDTGFDGYAAGLGGAEGADAYVPNREKQLGRPVASRESALAPDVVGGALAGKRVAAMDAGRCHGVVAAEDGRVYAFGCGALGGEGRHGEPRLVRDAPERAVDVAAGEYFTLALGEDGDLVGWGDGKSGQLGVDPAMTDESRTRAATVPVGGKTLAPFAGYQHAVAVVRVDE